MSVYGWIYIADDRDLSDLATVVASALGYSGTRRRGDCILFGEEDEHCLSVATPGALIGGEDYPKLLLLYDEGVNYGDVPGKTLAAHDRLLAAGIGPLLVIDEVTERVLRGKRILRQR